MTKTPDGKPSTHEDIENGNIAIGQAWKIVDQAFNDFAYTKIHSRVYDTPLKFIPDWLAPDGIYGATVRQVNLPVLKSFRTAGVVRGPHPYALVMDDIQRDCIPSRYDMNFNLMKDLILLKTPVSGAQPGDLFVAGSASLDPSGALKPGEPALLMRMLQVKGELFPPVITEIDKQNILTLTAKAVSPDFKLLLYPFKSGDPLPVSTWDTNQTEATLEFPDQKDDLTFSPTLSGKTDLKISRNGAEIVAVNAPVTKLNDPDSDHLTDELKNIPAKLAAMNDFDPEKIPGLVASWPLDQVKDGVYPATQANVPGIPVETSTVETSVMGRAASVPNTGLTVPLSLKGLIDQQMTFSFWVKSNLTPNMGNLFEVNGNNCFTLKLTQSQLGFDAQHKWTNGGFLSSSLLKGWTHYAVTNDGQTMILYCNGSPLLTFPDTTKLSYTDKILLGGGPYGGFTGSFRQLRIYNQALDADTIQKFYLQGLMGN